MDNTQVFEIVFDLYCFHEILDKDVACNFNNLSA